MAGSPWQGYQVVMNIASPGGLALGAVLLMALTSCVGYVDGGYGGGAVVVAQPDVFLYGGGYDGGGYNHGGHYDRGPDVHGYSQRGAASRGAVAVHGGGGGEAHAAAGHVASAGHNGGGGKY
jgi:hypothetical protein